MYKGRWRGVLAVRCGRWVGPCYQKGEEKWEKTKKKDEKEGKDR